MPKSDLRAGAKYLSKLSSVLKPTNGKAQPGQIMVVRPSFSSFQTEPAEEAAVDEVPEPVTEVISEPIVEVQPEPVEVVKPMGMFSPPASPLELRR